MKRVLIAGIGNVLLGDDEVGPCVASWMKANYSFPDGVEVEDLGTPALDFIDHLAGLDALIVVDAVNNSEPPGTITEYRKEDLMRNLPAVRMDHSPAVTESLMAAEIFFGVSPPEVLLIGITGKSYAAQCALSAPVSQALTSTVSAVLAELQRLGVGFTQTTGGRPPSENWSPVLQDALA
jgi:hydrogenase maturation protease